MFYVHKEHCADITIHGSNRFAFCPYNCALLLELILDHNVAATLNHITRSLLKRAKITSYAYIWSRLVLWYTEMVNIHMKLLWNFHVTRTLTNIDFSIVIGGYLVHSTVVVKYNIISHRVFINFTNYSSFMLAKIFWNVILGKLSSMEMFYVNSGCNYMRGR